ncbi:MAG: hypothetical protein BWK73_25555 [Thiothrix lacustris]|uniref:Uncharacterized protein n=1 Tax=Thiothrix lacustris TaxID=525917 RepID=A0A1Y1QLL0_9GAMM|nr:MAG: hypothetical protein BWK73_25555 [Thiothrix lacustris]
MSKITSVEVSNADGNAESATDSRLGRTIPIYATNAAAKTAGLNAGDFYATLNSDGEAIVKVVT